MNLYTDIALLLVVGIGSIFGYFLMKHIDKMLQEEHCPQQHKEEISLMIHLDDISEEELIQKIRKFRQKHKDTYIKISSQSITDDENMLY